MQKCKHLRRSRKCDATFSAQSKMQGASNGRLWLTAQISRQKVVSIGRYCSDQYRPLCVWGNLCNFVCQKKATREIQTKLSTYYKEKKGGQEHASDSNRKNYGRGSQRHLRSDRKPMEEQDDSAGVERHGRYKPHLVCPVQRQAGGVLPKRNRGWRHRTGFGQIHRQNLPHRLLPHRG